MKTNFTYVNQNNIKTRQYCNYGDIYLNTLGSKLLADNFIRAVSRQT